MRRDHLARGEFSALDERMSETFVVTLGSRTYSVALEDVSDPGATGRGGMIRAVVDGQDAVNRLLHAGERVELRARQEVALTVGDAGTFRYTLNARPTRPLGNTLQVRRVTITRANFRTFLADTVER